VVRRVSSLGFSMLAALVMVVCASIGHSAAAPARKPGGVTVSPAFQQVVLEQSDAEKTFDYAITNNTSQSLEFALSSVDFGSLDETGGVLFQGQSDKSLDYKYGLSRFVTLQQDRIVVEPKATTKIPVIISNKESMSPGGHYGAILATPTQAAGDPSKVQVNQVISTLLFVTKKGGEIYKMGLQSMQLKTHLFSAPSSVEMRFQNAGNVHVIPRGLITITDPRGRIVKRGYINEGSAILLPETFRKVSVPLRTINTAWWPGMYHMTITYRFDGQVSQDTKQMTFTYVNGWYIVILMLLFALIILGIVSRPMRRIFIKAGRIAAWPFKRLFQVATRRKK
jgi:hypothetical protein